MKDNIIFKEIKYSDTIPFLLKKHYAHRIPSISYAYGVVLNKKIVGVLTFGAPASYPLTIGIAGKRFYKKVLELNRLYIDDGYDYKNLASQLISYGLKCLKPLNKIIVSYADCGMQHVGYVYQATNFLYTGKTKERTDKYVGPGKHPRHYEDGFSKKYRVVRSSKYRYVYIDGDKRFKKEVLSSFKYPIYSKYPKGISKHYKVGESKTIKLVKYNYKGKQ